MKRRINWEQVRHRLRESERAVEEALTATPMRIEEAYRQRAVRLASTEVNRQPLSAGLPVLVFRLAQERYAIELKDVSEVLALGRCAPVPGAPPQFLGVISLRGELRAVVDLARLIVPSANASSEGGFVLMIRRQGQEIGMRVDSIEELREIRPEELSAPAQGNYVKGIASDTLLLLEIDALLAAVFSKRELVTT